MDHIGIDLGGRESQICVRKADGAITEELRMETRLLGVWLGKQATSRVVVETCSEAQRVASWARTSGHEVRVVPSSLVPSLGVGARRTKSDQRDARALSAVSCRVELPSVHTPSEQSNARRTLCAMRDTLVRSRTSLINSVRGWLRQQVVALQPGHAEGFPQRVRRYFEAHSATPPPRMVERQLETIESLTQQIAEADQEVETIVRGDEVCRRLMTVPGVGPLTALRFTAVIDDPARFSTAHEVESYLGLVPGEHSSGERTQRTGITKAGSTALRWTLVQACWCARRCRPNDPMVLWAADVEKRRGKRVATLALARKLAGILWAIWRKGTTYDPARAARGPSTPATAPSTPAAEESVACGRGPGRRAPCSTTRPAPGPRPRRRSGAITRQ